MTGSHRRTTPIVTAAVAIGLLGGGAATYAATSVTDSPAGAGAIAVSAGMMDGRDTGMGMGMGVGSFDADAPFDAQFLAVELAVNEEAPLLKVTCLGKM